MTAPPSNGGIIPTVVPRPVPDFTPVVKQSVQTFEKVTDSLSVAPGGSESITLIIAQNADLIVPWGKDVKKRDIQLREFWPGESTLAGALYGVAASQSAFNWRVDGPEKTVRQVHELLHQSDFGRGWVSLITKVTLDLMTQDNGAFIEIIHDDLRDARSPILGLSHLDSGSCVRTGNPEYPIIHYDRDGKPHRLGWWQVIPIEELPSPIQSMRNVQYCAVTRVLRASQILRDIAVYRGEKVSGRWQRAVHIVGGPARQEIKDALALDQAEASNMGLRRYMVPTIIASLDPSKPVSHVEIPLASLPDGFDLDSEMKWYIAQVALGIGRDYQDIAPLPSGGLGSGQQSEMLHLKSHGKGPALFMKILEHKLNYHGVMPRTCSFKFEDQDLRTEMSLADLKLKRAQRRQIMIQSREITPEMSRQIAADEGDIPSTLMDKIGETDVTPNIALSDTTVFDEESVTGGGSLKKPDKVLPGPESVVSSRIKPENQKTPSTAPGTRTAPGSKEVSADEIAQLSLEIQKSRHILELGQKSKKKRRKITVRRNSNGQIESAEIEDVDEGVRHVKIVRNDEGEFLGIDEE